MNIESILQLPEEEWTDKICSRAIICIGYRIFFEEKQYWMNKLHTLFRTHRININPLMNVFAILDNQWDYVPQELYRDIETIADRYVRYIIYASVSDKSLLKAIMKSEPEMLRRILKRCKNSWFKEHTINIVCGSDIKKQKVPGIYYPDDCELFDFIANTLGIKWNTKQTVTIEDVFDCKNSNNPRVKSYKGTICNMVCNDREKYIPHCFNKPLVKIPTVNKKGYKSPDWVIESDGAYIGTVECFAGDCKNIAERVRVSIRHSEDKETGKEYYQKMYELDDNSIRIAVHVHSIPFIDMSDTSISWMSEVIRSIPKDSKMDGLLYVWVDEYAHQIRPFYFDITGHNISDMLVNDVQYISVSKFQTIIPHP